MYNQDSAALTRDSRVAPACAKANDWNVRGHAGIPPHLRGRGHRHDLAISTQVSLATAVK